MVLLVLLIFLTTHYVTYVITKSEFPPIHRAREAVFDRWGEGTWQAYLATCAWCAGFYIAGVITLCTLLVTPVPLPVLVWLSAAGVTGFILEVVELMWSKQHG